MFQKLIYPLLTVAVVMVGFADQSPDGVENVFQTATEQLLRHPTIEATAYGYGQNRQAAKLAAMDQAGITLLEKIMGLRLTSERLVKDSKTLKSLVTSQIEGRISGHQVASEQIQRFSDSTSKRDRFEARICLRLDLKSMAPQIGRAIELLGAESPVPALAELPNLPTLTPNVNPTSPAKRNESSKPASYTGLVIDARGLKLQTAIAPKIYTQVGGKLRQLYGFSHLPDEVWLNGGMVEYASSLSQARKRLKHRIGSRPLLIKAAAASGTRFKTDVVVDHASAIQIFTADLTDLFLEQAKVVFLID